MMKTTLASVAVLVTIFASSFGAIQVADSRYTPVSQFEQHLANEESQYVLELKQQIRELRRFLESDPSDRYLQDSLADLINTLCEIRPGDKLCQ